MTALLGGRRGIRLIPPLSHAATIAAMRGADLVLCDSGGMQEEAPALGVPLLVLRDKTERPEGLAMRNDGTGRHRSRAGSSRGVSGCSRNRPALAVMARPRLPFGDGHAAPRIAALLPGISRRNRGSRAAKLPRLID